MPAAYVVPAVFFASAVILSVILWLPIGRPR